MWFPKAKPGDLVTKAAWLLKMALDRGFEPTVRPDEPCLFALETTPVHPYLSEALTEALKRPGKAKIQACNVGVDTICPICEEPIAKRQQAALCTEKSAKGLTAYLVCTTCCRELE